MVRLIASAVALMLLPSFAASQTAQGTVRAVSVSSGAAEVEATGSQETVEWTAFSADDLYRAQWLIAPETDPPSRGSVLSFAGAEEARASRQSARPYDEVIIDVESGTFLPGARLHAYRVTRSILDLGEVVTPTGTLTVQETRAGMVVATVDKIYHRMALGDRIDVLPAFTLRPGAEAQPVAGAMEAQLIEFPVAHELQSPGDYVFLGSGSNDGVGAGDLFDVIWTEVQGGPERIEGRVRIVRVDQDHSTGLIVDLANPVFHKGVWVRLSARMR